MEQTTTAKAVTAVLSGLVTIAATVFAVQWDWLTPELTVTVGTLLTAVLVYFVPNEPVDPVE